MTRAARTTARATTRTTRAAATRRGRTTATVPAAAESPVAAFTRAQEMLIATLERLGFLSNGEAARVRTSIGDLASCAARDATKALARGAQLSTRLANLLDRGDAASARTARQSLEVLDAIARLCASAVDPAEIFAAVLATLQHAVPFEGGTLFFFDPVTEKLEPVATRGSYVNLIDGVAFAYGNGFSAWLAREKRPVLLANLHRTSPAALPAVRSYLGVPLIINDTLVGVVSLGGTRPGMFTEEHQRLLTLVGAQAAAVLERLAHQRSLAAMAIRDALTGLYNRNHFEERLGHEVERARRCAMPLSLVLLDVDGMSSVNDGASTTTGDQVMIELASVLKGRCRSSDILARYDGDKFAVLLPAAEAERAEAAAERLRATIENHAFPRRRRLTVSIGVASLPPATGAAELLSGAEVALYTAKLAGRNRVASAGGAGPTDTGSRAAA